MGIDNLHDVLTWLIGGGAAVLAAMLVSFLVENNKSFQALDATTKRGVMIAVSVVIALVAWAILTYVPPTVFVQLQAPFAIIVMAVSSTLANQAWHTIVNKSS